MPPAWHLAQVQCGIQGCLLVLGACSECPKCQNLPSSGFHNSWWNASGEELRPYPQPV